MKTALIRGPLCIAAWLCACGALSANTFTAASGDWHNPANWSDGVVPGDGASVVINGNVNLTNSTAALQSYSLTAGKTHTFDGWDTLLSATTVTISGTMTHAPNTAVATNPAGLWMPNARVNIACTDFMLEAGGSVNVDNKGFAGGKVGSLPGKGPGGGIGTGGGAGHGGASGTASGSYGLAYGDGAAPTMPGSGGGNNGGGAGGGAVRIVASGIAVVNGRISAGGQRYTTYGGGGGSGGAVLISCNTIAGGGSVRAAGASGSGAGGRISIVYNPAAQAALPIPSMEISAAGGWWSDLIDRSGRIALRDGGLGSLWFPDSQFMTRASAEKRLCGVWLPPLSRVALDSLSLRNSWLRFPQSGFVLEVTNNFSMAVDLADTELPRYALEMQGEVRCGGNFTISQTKTPSDTAKRHALILRRDASGNGGHMTCGGDMTLAQNAELWIEAGTAKAAAPFEGALVAVGGKIETKSGSFVVPLIDPASGGAARFTAARLVVGPGSGFNADGCGYLGGSVNAQGLGPGGGRQGGGGGHGGLGGADGTGYSGKAYGDLHSPITAGSGGGAGGTYVAGAGGGVVWISLTGPATVNGAITANGFEQGGYGSGGGAGGSVLLQCSAIAGTNGVISAGGGLSSASGSGAGGRISVVYNSAAQDALPIPDVKFAAPAGTTPGNQGQPGSLYFPDSRFLLAQSGVVRHSGQWLADGMPAVWQRPALVMEDSWLHFPGEGFVIDVAGAISLKGSANALLSRIDISNGVVKCGGNMTLDKSRLTLMRGSATRTQTDALAVAGSMTMKNGSTIIAQAPGTNNIHGVSTLAVRIGGDMLMEGAGSWVYPESHPFNGGVVEFSMRNLNIASGSGFDSSKRGFAGGPNNSAGFGPGRGIRDSGGNGGGGGFGGDGGRANGIYGMANGNALAPWGPGSGGGSSSYPGGYGGGAIRIAAERSFRLDGLLAANGNVGGGYAAGGGSGGAIFVSCWNFAGGSTAQMQANGGTGSTGGGGGGRIAVWQRVPSGFTAYTTGNPTALASLVDYSGTASVAFGTAGTGHNGVIGTIAYLLPPPTGTIIVVR